MLAKVHPHPRLVIVANPTASDFGHPPSSDDPQASLRAELLGQLMAAQFEIEAAMNEMEGNAAALSDGKAQLQLLSALQRQIGVASPTALAGMRGEIIATASAAQTVVQQSRAAALTSERMAELQNVTNATRQTIQNVAEDLFEKKKLDPYLQFQSAEDEAEYRKREAERKAYIDAELAKGTPEGALNASNAAKAQIKDAGAHGADRSPEYADMLAATDKAEQALRSAMSSERQRAGEKAGSPKAHDDLNDVLSAFRDAGVTTAETPSLDPAHGLAQGKPSAPARGV